MESTSETSVAAAAELFVAGGRRVIMDGETQSTACLNGLTVKTTIKDQIGAHQSNCSSNNLRYSLMSCLVAIYQLLQ